MPTSEAKAFQDLCAQVMGEELKTTVSMYRETQDAGQDAVFLAKSLDGLAVVGTVVQPIDIL